MAPHDRSEATLAGSLVGLGSFRSRTRDPHLTSHDTFEVFATDSGGRTSNVPKPTRRIGRKRAVLT